MLVGVRPEAAPRPSGFTETVNTRAYPPEQGLLPFGFHIRGYLSVDSRLWRLGICAPIALFSRSMGDLPVVQGLICFSKHSDYHLFDRHKRTCLTSALPEAVVEGLDGLVPIPLDLDDLGKPFGPDSTDREPGLYVFKTGHATFRRRDDRLTCLHPHPPSIPRRSSSLYSILLNRSWGNFRGHHPACYAGWARLCKGISPRIAPRSYPPILDYITCPSRSAPTAW